MRLFVKLILIVYAAVLIAGVLFIFDRIYRKVRVERHYTFAPFKKDGKHGFSLDNDAGRHVFYAYNNKEDGDFAVFRFVKPFPRLTSVHKISGPGKNPKAPNFTNVSFLFDKEDIWDYLKNRGISIEMTVVDDKYALYKIRKDSKPVAFAKKRFYQDENVSRYTYTMRTYELKKELLFIVLFAIAKTEMFSDIIKSSIRQHTETEKADNSN